MAHIDGSGHDDTNVVPIALARLERLIQLRLSDPANHGTEPAISVKVLDADPDLPQVPEDPALYDAFVDRLVTSLDQYLDGVADGAELSVTALNDEIEAAFVQTSLIPRSSDRFVGRLRCMQCGAVTADAQSGCETFLRAQPDNTSFTVGSEFEFVHEEVTQDYYARTVATPTDPAAPVHILEGWECPHCEGLNWAEIVLRDSLVSCVWSVALSRQLLQRAHYVTSECVELASRIAGRPAWSLVGNDVFEILFEELEAH